ncbi:DUF481 domain-containing protein [Gallaecimonas sp. GXIMD4217]|uniref:DUF481 domain-containing protein n=1 Tax=Gallaecimonas sp. GXIMD4217 TaxID=3131927 RepID=UPI00311B0380
MKLTYCLPVLALVAVPVMAEEEAKSWEGEAELGALITSGNTNETNIKGRIDVTHDMENWRNNYLVEYFNSEKEEQTTAEKYRAAAQGDYKFNDKDFWFVRGSYEKDRFSGFDFQAVAATGYGSRVWKQDKNFLELAGGLGYRFNKLEMVNEAGEDSEEEYIARLSGRFEYHLSKTALFKQEIQSEIGLEDNNVITESITSVQASVMGNLAMKVAYKVKHTSKVPADTDKTDTETSLTLLYTF